MLGRSGIVVGRDPFDEIMRPQCGRIKALSISVSMGGGDEKREE